jgi:hypothetical protein
MSNLYPVAGSHIFIGGVLNPGLVDLTAADFSSQTWTEIDGWSTMGSFGDTAALISTDLINRGRTTKQKGTTNAGQMQNVFALIPGDPGQAALITASAGAVKDNYAFKIEFSDAPAPKSNPVTISIATPGVVSWTAHGLTAGTGVKFSTTGSLPTGITAGTTYYVIAAGLTADSFQISATPGGAAINTTGTQSGTHTATTVTSPSGRLFSALVMNTNEAGGEANTIRNLQATLEINSNVVVVAAQG